LNLLALGSATVIVVTAAYHSWLGERRVIASILALDSKLLAEKVRRALRFTWHLTSLLMLLTAATILWPQAPTRLIGLIGAVYLLLGLVTLWLSKGRHPSFILFGTAGITALLAAL
jgi:hypothetical protein